MNDVDETAVHAFIEAYRCIDHHKQAPPDV